MIEFLLTDRAQLYHGDSVAEPLPCACDLLCVDAPYSERTHNLFNNKTGLPDPKKRRTLNYARWTPRQVRAAVRAWHPMTRGWMVSITDNVLAPHWASAMEKVGRYVFAPLPAVITGANIRLAGDGPSSWTRWIVVSRPRSRDYQRWGTLQGAYVGPSERMAVVGGKPLWLMRALVRDYSRPGDVVCDPCCGGGTTLVAALEHGRRAVGVDLSEEHCAISREAVERVLRQPSLFEAKTKPEQRSLLKEV